MMESAGTVDRAVAAVVVVVVVVVVACL
jgi:hypothetical protein